MKFGTTVNEIISRTDDVKSFRFVRPESFGYKPGQFMFITIKINEKNESKHFTISSSPTEKDYVEFTKRLTGHPFSNALDELKMGDWAEIDGPYGNFTFEGESPKIAMLTGGIGITPLRSICRYSTDLDLSNKITLLYSNHNENDIIFREELLDMQKKNENLKVIFTLTESGKDWTGNTGRIDTNMIKSEIPDFQERAFYVSGPPAMVDAMANLLTALEIPQTHIKRDNFLGY